MGRLGVGGGPMFHLFCLGSFVLDQYLLCNVFNFLLFHVILFHLLSILLLLLILFCEFVSNLCKLSVNIVISFDLPIKTQITNTNTLYIKDVYLKCLSSPEKETEAVGLLV